MTRAQKIIAIAKTYLNKMEKPGNTGFFDSSFEKDMKAVGWYVKAPWCAFFAKLVWQYVYCDNPTMLKHIKRLNSGGCLDTLKNHKEAGIFQVCDHPVPGALVIWAHGKGPTGHIGIVVSVDGNTMTTIEGNTNASGSREGDRVAEKLRTVVRPFQAAGLNIRGYIHPLEI